MHGYVFYRKLITLSNGESLLLRFLNSEDGDYLKAFSHELPEENRQWLEGLLKEINYRQVLPLVAVDLAGHRFAACATLRRGERPTLYLGELYLWVSKPYGETELGSFMLEELMLMGKRL